MENTGLARTLKVQYRRRIITMIEADKLLLPSMTSVWCLRAITLSRQLQPILAKRRPGHNFTSLKKRTCEINVVYYKLIEITRMRTRRNLPTESVAARQSATKYHTSFLVKNNKCENHNQSIQSRFRPISSSRFCSPSPKIRFIKS